MGFHMPVWEDLRAPATGVDVAGPATPATPDSTHPSLIFANAATNTAFIAFQLPHQWIEGSILRPHIHWAPMSTNTGDVYWRLEYQFLNTGDVVGAYTTVNILATAGGVDEALQLNNFGDVSTTGVTISAMMLCKLSRIGGDGTDTFTSTARLYEFDVHYRSAGLGSIQEYVKNGP